MISARTSVVPRPAGWDVVPSSTPSLAPEAGSTSVPALPPRTLAHGLSDPTKHALAPKSTAETIGPRSARQLKKAPPAFSVDSNKAVFVDFENVNLEVVFDPATRQASVKATIDFMQPEAGFPISDLVTDVDSVVIDGKQMTASAYSEVSDPEGRTTMRVLKEALAPGRHRMELTYPLERGVRWSGDGVSFFQDISDLSNRRFAEQYFPSNFEFDQYQTSMSIRIKGAEEGSHRVIANGDMKVEQDGADTVYSIDFPAFYTTSSYFVHVLDPNDWEFVEGTYQGENGPIPVTAYASNGFTARRALNNSMKYLEELEGRWGPFPHASYNVRISGWGGMEHSGATITSMGALGHETAHQWLARGTLPANGDSGWMDEALASWRDNGYPRASSIRMGTSYPQLAGRSPYIRTTPQASYSHGANVMKELDYIFRDQGGISDQVKEFVTIYRHQTVTTEMFVSFLDARWPTDAEIGAKEYFALKIYGGGRDLSEAAAEAYETLSGHLADLLLADSEEAYERALLVAQQITTGEGENAKIARALDALPAHLREELTEMADVKLRIALTAND